MNTSSAAARLDRAMAARPEDALGRRLEVARGATDDQPAPRLFEELPGIVDVVWAVLARTAPGPAPVRLVFAAPDRGAGTTVLAAATAIGLVRSARVPVCLVETNFARPALADYLGLERAGLSDLLDGRAEIEDCLRTPRACPGLYVLPAGTPRKPLSGELTTARMRQILERLGALGRYLVIDAPSLLEHLESRVLARAADSTVLVLRAGATRSANAARAHRMLLEAGAPLLGSVFNAFGSERAFSRTDPYRLSEREIQGALAPVERAQATATTVNGTAGSKEGQARDTLGLDAAHEAHVGLATASAVAIDAPAMGSIDELAHRQEVDVLVRRIAKLTAQLALTETDLRRIAEAKHLELGVASLYRTVQGISQEDDALLSKRDLMGKIFQTNLELHRALQRSP